MKKEKELELALDQLDRTHAFFPRVDNKSSALFAINAGILAVLGLNFKPGDLETWYMTAPAFSCLVLVMASLFWVYKSSFPTLEGGQDSLVYFKSIAERTEATYLRDIRSCSIDSYTNDLLSQIWRNSEILSIKFKSARIAFICTATSLVPWSIFLVCASVSNNSSINL